MFVFEVVGKGFKAAPLRLCLCNCLRGPVDAYLIDEWAVVIHSTGVGN